MSTPIPTNNPQRPDAVLTVGQLNRLARQLLEDCFPAAWVEGEISNLSKPSSGHWYFTLKDTNAQIRCAMFRNRNFRLRFQPSDGSKVLVKGAISLYEARGEYQLIAEDMLPAGEGLLAAQFELLKQKLQAEGLFDPARKKKLPEHIAHIAVITSPTGAAIRDILTVLKRRSPQTHVTVIPVPVQGDQAPASIVQALTTANRLKREGKQLFDAILLGRGGGSLEDLWAFNDEKVARAIAASELPVVSAVGHEVDFTIADFVADLRAPTPSAGAELLSRDHRQQLQQLNGWKQRLINAWQRTLSQKRQQLEWRRRQIQHPSQRLRQWSLRLDELDMRLMNAHKRHQRDLSQRLQLLSTRLQAMHPRRHLLDAKTRLQFLQKRLHTNMLQSTQRHAQRLASLAQLLNTVSPLNTLQRGYAIVSDSEKHVLRDAKEINVGATVHARLARGELICTVQSITTAESTTTEKK
ncbi:MAG: exodeoxyribonuclease VII large subunit [Spongiibacteraceae bacterium]